jgi:elongation factor 1 alpha-like protein
VNWDQARYDEIIEDLRPFLIQSGFAASKTKFVPVGAMAGVNLVRKEQEPPTRLGTWYHGPTLVDLLGTAITHVQSCFAPAADLVFAYRVDQLDPPTRSIDSPLRLPISNVFKGQTSLSSGLGVSGRVCSGVVQVGERLRVLPGDENTVVRRKCLHSFWRWASELIVQT